MKITFLGTSGMVPTKERNVQGIYLDYKGEGILLDCGEGTQRQIQFAGLNAQKIKIILISHWHGDHVSGLIGLIQTLGNFSNGEKTVHLYGPPGTKEHLAHLMGSCIFENKLFLKVHELNSGKLKTFYETDEYALQAINLEHSVPCIGYRFVKKSRRKMNQTKLIKLGIKGPMIGRLQSGHSVTIKGKEITPEQVSTMQSERSVAFIFDTVLTKACYTLAKNVNLLISEAVHLHELEEKANEYKHLTAHQAAQIASEAGAERLILTHFSQRYKTTSAHLKEAKEIFPNVTCAHDLLKVNLPF